jgi:hypothetical protein
MTTQNFHFDEAKIAAKNEEMRAIYAKRFDSPGVDGVMARLKDAVMPASVMAMIREINRGTSPEDLYRGIASLIAHVAITYIFSATGGTEGSLEARTIVANLLMSEMGKYMGHALNIGNDSIAAHVAAEQSGSA